MTPHLWLPPPWNGDRIPLQAGQAHHLYRVLRSADGDPVTYTDGQGQRGKGKLAGDQIRRGEEDLVPRPHPEINLYVAPPVERNRTRFLVEKCTELGLRRLTWLITRQSRSHPPAFQRARAWMREALEQSHGCWLPQFSEQNESPYGLNSETIFCIPGSPSPTAQASPSQVSLAVGPESGWAKGEVPAASPKMGLGSNILRVETAAIAAVAWWRLQVS